MNCNAVGSFKPSDDYINITWCMNSRCFYKCKYCKIKDEEPNYSLPEMISVMRFINELPHKHKEVTLFGGEPTYIIYLPQFIQEMQKAGIEKINVFTNLGLPQAIQMLPKDIWINGTFHPDQTTADVFIECLEMVKDYKFNFINVMMVGKESEWKKVCKYLIEHDIPHRLVPVWGISEKSDWLKSAKYTETLPEHLAMKNIHVQCSDGSVKKMTEQELVFSETFDFNGWECYAGKNSIYIDQFGDIFRCQEDLNKGKEIGHIYEDILPKLESLTCEHKKCTCEYYIPKRIPNVGFNW